MADNITLPGTGQVVATKENGGVDYQVVQIADNAYAISNLATIENQTNLKSLIETLQELIHRLAPLAGAMANTAQLRVVATGTVTASGPITSAQSIAEKNVAGVSYTQRVAIENNTAIQSNIQNIIAK